MTTTRRSFAVAAACIIMLSSPAWAGEFLGQALGTEIDQLVGVTGNVQGQIDSITEAVTDNETAISNLSDNVDLKLTITDIDDEPVDGETSAPVSSNYTYDHRVIDEDDFTTNSDARPPSQQSVLAILRNGWTIDLDDLVEDVPQLVTHLTFTAAESFVSNSILYMKSDGADGGRLYKYNADSTAADNDTYRFFCKSTESSRGDGDSVNVRLFSPMWVQRDDTLTTTYNSSEGKSLVADDTGNGWEVFFASAPSGEGDHVEFTGLLLQAQDAGAGTHDTILFFGGFDMNVIPAAAP